MNLERLRSLAEASIAARVTADEGTTEQFIAWGNAEEAFGEEMTEEFVLALIGEVERLTKALVQATEIATLEYAGDGQVRVENSSRKYLSGVDELASWLKQREGGGK